jgi:hypothetical protein
MADDDLRDIEARMAAAIPGPWEYMQMRDGRWVVHNGDAAANVISTENEADAAFVAHACQDIKSLIEEIRVLRGYLNHVQAGDAPMLGGSIIGT